jgi:anti-sigma factor (TIGR02949 family)
MTGAQVIDCEEALRLLFEALDAELSNGSREAFERHLEHCRSCFSRFEFEKRLKAHIGRLGTETPRVELRDRIRTVLNIFKP